LYHNIQIENATSTEQLTSTHLPSDHPNFDGLQQDWLTGSSCSKSRFSKKRCWTSLPFL